ncbi:MAG TPA: J domain-containing protein, partial [Treponemataceae bacterium]|nr:J domain-containing protein [Treponemataceae bacterium]
MSSAAEKIELEKNLSLVLGKPVNLHNPEVLTITPDELKKIYHKRAKELHPDTAASTGKDPVYLTTKFKSLSESYSYVLNFWKERNFSSVIRNSAAAQGPLNTRNYRQPYESPAGKTQNTKQQKVHTRQKGQREPAFEKRFYNGPMPCFQLRFAQFMYYSKKADWHTFIKSLSWQWKVRPRLGELAVKQ